LIEALQGFQNQGALQQTETELAPRKNTTPVVTDVQEKSGHSA